MKERTIATAHTLRELKEILDRFPENGILAKPVKLVQTSEGKLKLK